MQPAARDLITGKLGLNKAKFLVREAFRLGLSPRVPAASHAWGHSSPFVVRALLPAAREAGRACGDVVRAGRSSWKAIVARTGGRISYRKE